MLFFTVVRKTGQALLGALAVKVGWMCAAEELEPNNWKRRTIALVKVTLAHAQLTEHFSQEASRGVCVGLCIPLWVSLLVDVCDRRQLKWRVAFSHYDEPKNCCRGTDCLPFRSCFEPRRTALTTTNCYSWSSYEVFEVVRGPLEPSTSDGQSS